MKKILISSFLVVACFSFGFAQKAAAPVKKKPTAAPVKKAEVAAPAVTVNPSTATTTAPTPAESTAEINFDVENHDFGTIKEGNQATYEFKFTNTGKEELILTAVNASCGCTTPTWTKEPIKPGKTGVIIASYNSAGRPGMFTKSITVQSNAKSGTKTLTIRGNVVKEATEQPSPVIVNPQ